MVLLKGLSRHYLNDEPQLLGGSITVKNFIQWNCLVKGIDVALEHGVNRDHVVSPVDFYAVSGEVDNSDIGVTHSIRKIMQGAGASQLR